MLDLGLFLLLGRIAPWLDRELGVCVVMAEAKVAPGNRDATVGAVAEFNTPVAASWKAANEFSSMLFIFLDGEVGRLEVKFDSNKKIIV